MRKRGSLRTLKERIKKKKYEGRDDEQKHMKTGELQRDKNTECSLSIYLFMPVYLTRNPCISWGLQKYMCITSPTLCRHSVDFSRTSLPSSLSFFYISTSRKDSSTLPNHEVLGCPLDLLHPGSSLSKNDQVSKVNQQTCPMAVYQSELRIMEAVDLFSVSRSK